MPPAGHIYSDLNKYINFYQDAIIVNTSLFLLRDNVVYIVDTFTKQLI